MLVTKSKEPHDTEHWYGVCEIVNCNITDKGVRMLSGIHSLR